MKAKSIVKAFKDITSKNATVRRTTPSIKADLLEI
jgi:hypothetical protein